MRIDRAADGIITVHVSGRLTFAEWRAAQESAAAWLSAPDAGARMLVIVEDFLGWDRDGAWEDTSFQSRFDKQIDRLAIVGEKKWEDLVLMFVGKGLRRIEIEYFLPTEIERARAWLKTTTAGAAPAAKGSKP